jgi:uncharacterized lipoprotein
MSLSVSIPRALIAGALLAALVATSGCGWFRKGDKLYAADPESRPLEVPPPLPAPGTEGTTSVSASSVTASGEGRVSPPLGFNTGGTRDEAFERLGEALAGIEGVTVASQAKLLGAYDVNYAGSNFLVRVSEIEGGVYVSAVDPRGVPASGDGPTRLIGALQAAIGK